MEKDPRVYIRHILEAITNIETDTAGYDFEKFRMDRRARQLVERNLEILSEASRRHDTYPTVLWDTCKKDLAPLKAAVLRIAGGIGT